MPAYRIAFVNPYVTAAEVQAFASLQGAAETMDITLEHRKPTDIHEEDPYDFVIPVAFTPKTTSHPSFLSCHSPRAVYVDNEEMFGAIASHDGYFTISDNLRSFFSSLCSGYGKPLVDVGDYYNCPQTTDIATDVPALQASGELGLCYFGINWDMRAEPLFRHLSQQPYMRIYGPADSWLTVRPGAYKGQLPFDGSSVQKEYARFGVGLVCLGYEHLIDDIISNRVFEISSVGAVSISPDTPWMRRNFGESVFYYDPFASIDAIVSQIDAAFQAIRTVPAEAQRMAAHARAIFEDRFHAGAMLRGAVAHFERWKTAAQIAPALAETPVDIIIRAGSPAGLSETIASLRRQRAGRFRVLLVGRAQSATDRGGDFPIIAFDDLPSALRAVNAQVFAILTAGDRLLSHHFERLLPPLIAGAATLSYADVLAPQTPGEADLAIRVQGPAGGAVGDILDRLPLACLLMARPAIEALLAWPGLAGAQDRLLAARLLASGRAEHRPGPTCILSGAPPKPAADLEEQLALALEIGPLLAALRLNAPAVKPSLLAPIAQAVTDIGEAKLETIAPERVFEGGMIGRDVGGRADLIHVDVPLTPNRLAAITPWTKGEDGVLRFQPAAAFDVALRVDIGDYILPGCRPSIVFALERAEDTLFLGMADARGEIVARTITPKSRKPLKVWVNSLFGAPPVEAIIQAWKRAPCEPIGLTGLTLAYRVEEVAAALGRANMTRAEALCLLTERAETEVVGAPFGSSALQAIDLHHPRSVFRNAVDGEGPMRNFRSGTVGWDYFAQIFTPRIDGARALKLELEGLSEPASAFLTNTAFDAVLSPALPLRAGKASTTVWLPLPAEPQDLYLVLQADAAPQDREIVVRALSAAMR